MFSSCMTLDILTSPFEPRAFYVTLYQTLGLLPPYYQKLTTPRTKSIFEGIVVGLILKGGEGGGSKLMGDFYNSLGAKALLPGCFVFRILS